MWNDECPDWTHLCLNRKSPGYHTQTPQCKSNFWTYFETCALCVEVFLVFFTDAERKISKWFNQNLWMSIVSTLRLDIEIYADFPEFNVRFLLIVHVYTIRKSSLPLLKRKTFNCSEEPANILFAKIINTDGEQKRAWYRALCNTFSKRF